VGICTASCSIYKRINAVLCPALNHFLSLAPYSERKVSLLVVISGC
jgi:hypothetical protein